MKYENIDQDLSIGTDCYYMNLSGIYEINKSLYLTLGYTNLDFIYNKDTFTNFINPKPAIEYISKDNELFILQDIDSEYINDIMESNSKYEDLIHNANKYICEIKNKPSLEDLKHDYLINGKQIIFTTDHYYLYEDYKKVVTNFEHFHSPYHSAILCDIDFDRKVAYVIDKFYRFKGEVLLKNIEKSITSEYLVNSSFYYSSMEFCENDAVNKFNEMLKINFDIAKENTIIINSNEYTKNKIAIKEFINDFEINVKELYDQKGIYCPQFLSQLIKIPALKRESFGNLLLYITKFNKNEYLSTLLRLVNESKELWMRIDLLNDKSFLSKKSIIQNINKYKKVLNEIEEIDSKIYELIEKY